MRPTRRHAARAISLGFAAALLAGAAMAEPVYRHTLTNPIRVNAAVVEEPEVPEEPVAQIGLPSSVTVLPQESECTDVPVQSNGALDVTGMSASLSGTDASRFSLCTPSEQACGAELAVGESCNLGVRLDETAIGVYGAVLTVVASGGVNAEAPITAEIKEAPGSIFGIGHAKYTGSGTYKNVWTSMSEDNDWRAISAGQQFGYALKQDGSIWGTGDGGDAIGGVNTQEWVRVGSEKGFIAIAAGSFFGHALKADGSVWGIGSDGSSKLGGTGSRAYWAPVGTETGFIAISAGTDFGHALKADGSVWAIGRNNVYQTGGTSRSDKSEWTRIGTQDGFIAIAAGSAHGYALKSDGTVWGIGSDTSWQLGGNGNRSDLTRIGTLINVVEIGAGATFGYAITADGSVWGIGNNGSGQLGTGGNKNSWTKVGTETGFTAVSGGGGFGHAMKADGTIWGIGADSNGQIGGTTRNYWALINTAAGTATAFRSISTGFSHGYALK